jgi:hypothetical protein
VTNEPFQADMENYRDSLTIPLSQPNSDILPPKLRRDRDRENDGSGRAKSKAADCTNALRSTSVV